MQPNNFFGGVASGCVVNSLDRVLSTLNKP